MFGWEQNLLKVVNSFTNMFKSNWNLKLKLKTTLEILNSRFNWMNTSDRTKEKKLNYENQDKSLYAKRINCLIYVKCQIKTASSIITK